MNNPNPNPNFNPNTNKPFPHEEKAALISLVAGIIGLCLGWFSSGLVTDFIIGVISLAASIVAVIYGSRGLKIAQLNGGKDKGMATAGLVLGIIGIVLAAVGLLCGLCMCFSCGLLAGVSDVFGAV